MIVKALIIYLAIVVYFVLDAIAAQIYEEKGYKQIKGALWGLIPVYGIIRALKVPPLKAKSILWTTLLIAQITLVAIIVILPVIYMIGSSFADTSGLPTTFWPEKMTWGNYEDLFTGTKFVKWITSTYAFA